MSNEEQSTSLQVQLEQSKSIPSASLHAGDGHQQEATQAETKKYNLIVVRRHITILNIK